MQVARHKQGSRQQSRLRESRQEIRSGDKDLLAVRFGQELSSSEDLGGNHTGTTNHGGCVVVQLEPHEEAMPRTDLPQGGIPSTGTPG